MNNFRQISGMLAQRAEDIARHLLPNGKRQGSEWCVGSISGEAGESLKVHLVGDKAGVWCDFATGDKGDLLDLWAIKRNSKISEALKEASHYLGISTPKFDAHTPLKFVKPILKNLPRVIGVGPKFYINKQYDTPKNTPIFVLKSYSRWLN